MFANGPSGDAGAASAPRPVELTRRRRQVFDFICAYYQEHGIAPSCGDIAAHLGIKSKQRAYRLTRALEALGAITRQPYQVRSLVPVLPQALAVALPIDLERAVRFIAVRARTTPEAVVVAAVHARLAGIAAALRRRAQHRSDASERKTPALDAPNDSA
jgi:hypothetical protein